MYGAGEPAQLSLDALLHQNIEAKVHAIQEASKSQHERALRDFEARLLKQVRCEIDGLRQELHNHMNMQQGMNDSSRKQAEDVEQKLQMFQESATRSLMRQDTRQQVEELREGLGQHIDIRIQECLRELQDSVRFTPVPSEMLMESDDLNSKSSTAQDFREVKDSRSRTSSASIVNLSSDSTTLVHTCTQALPEVQHVQPKPLAPVVAEECPPADITSQPPASEEAIGIHVANSEVADASEERNLLVDVDAPVDAPEHIFPCPSPCSPTDYLDDERRPSISITNEWNRSKPRRAIWKRKRVLSVMMFFVAFALTAWNWKRYLTSSVILLLILWCLYLFAEAPTIKILSNQINGMSTVFCKRILIYLINLLKWVKGYRSSNEHDEQFHRFLWTFSAVLIMLNPDVSSLLTILLSLRTYNICLPAIALVLLIFVTFCCVCVVVSHAHQPTMRRRVSDGMESSAVSEEAKEAIEEITQLLKKGASGRKKRECEGRILDIFREAEDELLTTILEQMSIKEVISFFDDNRAQKARTEFLQMLCEERCEDLTIRSKFILLNALCCMKISSCGYGETAVKQLLLSCAGDGLSELKSMQDGGNGGGNVHTIHKIVYEYIQDPLIRKHILDHFLKEGISQVGQRTLMANTQFQRLLQKATKHGCLPPEFDFVHKGVEHYNGHCGHSWLKIFTDIDDTLECSGGRWPAGIDTRYARHTPYPGVTAFYKELQGGGEVGQLVALSARPHFYSNLVETSVLGKFMNLKRNHGLHCIPALLTGALDSSGKFLASGGDADGLDALGTKKYENIIEFLKLYPEFRLVFIGDNGQADYLVGKKICETFPQHVEQVWIHEVIAREKTHEYDANLSKDKPIRFIRNFIDAAIHASTRHNPLIKPEGLHRVVSTAIQDFKKIENWPSKENRAREAQNLNSSISEAVRILQENFGINAAIEPLDEPKDAQPLGAKESKVEFQIAPASPKSLPNPTKFGWPFSGRRSEEKQDFTKLSSPERVGHNSMSSLMEPCVDIKSEESNTSIGEQQNVSRLASISNSLFNRRKSETTNEPKHTNVGTDTIPVATEQEADALDAVGESSMSSDITASGTTDNFLSRLLKIGAKGEQSHGSPLVRASPSPTLPSANVQSPPMLPTPTNSSEALASSPKLLEHHDDLDSNGNEENAIRPSIDTPALPAVGNADGIDLDIDNASPETAHAQIESLENKSDNACGDGSIGRPNTVQSVVAWANRTLLGTGQKKGNEMGSHGESGEIGEKRRNELYRSDVNASFASMPSIPSCSSIISDAEKDRDGQEQVQDSTTLTTDEPTQTEAPTSSDNPIVAHEGQGLDSQAMNVPQPTAATSAFETLLKEPAGENTVSPTSLDNEIAELTLAPESKTCISPSDGVESSWSNMFIGNADETKDESMLPKSPRAVAPPSQATSENDSSSAANSPPCPPAVESIGVDCALQQSSLTLPTQVAEDSATVFEMVEEVVTSQTGKASQETSDHPS